MSVVAKKAQEKCFLGVSSPRGRSQLKMFCVAPPFIGETNTDELEKKYNLTNLAELASSPAAAAG